MFAHLQYNSIVFYETSETAGYWIQYIMLKKVMLSSMLVVLSVPVYISALFVLATTAVLICSSVWEFVFLIFTVTCTHVI